VTASELIGIHLSDLHRPADQQADQSASYRFVIKPITMLVLFHLKQE
jgi:hypothetical protein